MNVTIFPSASVPLRNLATWLDWDAVLILICPELRPTDFLSVFFHDQTENDAYYQLNRVLDI